MPARSAPKPRRQSASAARRRSRPGAVMQEPRPANPSTSPSSYFRYGGSEDWRVDERTRAAGRKGLEAARAALARIRADAEGPDPTENAA